MKRLPKKKSVIEKAKAEKKAIEEANLPTKMVCNCPTCSANGKPQALRNFYNMNSAVMSKYPICKDCVNQMIDVDRMETVYNMLRELNIAFNGNLWASSVSNNPDTPFPNYIRMMNSLHKGEGFSENQIKQSKYTSDDITNMAKAQTNKRLYNKPTKEMKEFWGAFSDEEICRMQNKYDFMAKSYPLKTNTHIENLRNYVKYAVKADIALEEGDFSNLTNWSSLAQKAADNAKLNVKQLTANDLAGGLTCFAELSQKVEEVVDIIPVLPQFKYRPNDSVDFTIWCMINYVRGLFGKDDIPYEEVYSFYDKRKANYIEETGDPFGLFKDDPTEKNREIIKKFTDIKDWDIEDE